MTFSAAKKLSINLQTILKCKANSKCLNNSNVSCLAYFKPQLYLKSVTSFYQWPLTQLFHRFFPSHLHIGQNVYLQFPNICFTLTIIVSVKFVIHPCIAKTSFKNNFMGLCRPINGPWQNLIGSDGLTFAVSNGQRHLHIIWL
jgi:hypothetical protein